MNPPDTHSPRTGRERRTAETAPATGQQGIALVVVLWLIVLLTVISSSHARNVHIETRLAFNQLDTARAHALAESGISLAILELFNLNLDERWQSDGTVYMLEFDQGRVEVSTRHASGLLDLNTADSVQLDAVLAAAGLDDTSRPELVDAILDWRDTDNLTHLHGAEDTDYRHAGFDWGARDGPFASVDELRYVMGMTGDLFNRLAPYLTVHSGSNTINLEIAPAWLYSALTGTDTELTEEKPAVTAAAADGTYHINARAITRAGSTIHVEAVVRTAAGSERPYTVLAWRLPASAIDSGN